MQNEMHFISGLPRSGSTLLSALLRQNPAIRAGIASPMGSLFSSTLREMSQNNEAAVFIDDSQREKILRGLFENYYHAADPTQTIFDSNRLWCAKTNLIAALFPQAKIICCVRHLAWILDSIERLIRQNRWELSKIFDFEAGGTVYSRADGLTSHNGLVGFAYNALKQAMQSEESDRLLLVSYQTLTQRPADALAAIYNFVGLPSFEHDFENVAFDSVEFDARLGTPGLHRVRPKVEAQERQSILPLDIWNRYPKENFWNDPAFNVRRVKVI